MTTPKMRCPTPAKTRYATRENAQSRAHYWSTMGDQKNYQIYRCPCGWYHLTSTGIKPPVNVPVVATAEEMLGLSPDDFRDVVAWDVKGRVDETTAEVLRDDSVLERWRAELKILWTESQTELLKARDDNHRKNILIFQNYVAVRRQEARNLFNEFVRQGVRPRIAETPGSKSSIRREALYQALRTLSNRYIDELGEIYREELKKITPEGEDLGKWVPMKFFTPATVDLHFSDLDVDGLPPEA